MADGRFYYEVEQFSMINRVKSFRHVEFHQDRSLMWSVRVEALLDFVMDFLEYCEAVLMLCWGNMRI